YEAHAKELPSIRGSLLRCLPTLPRSHFLKAGNQSDERLFECFHPTDPLRFCIANASRGRRFPENQVCLGNWFLDEESESLDLLHHYSLQSPLFGQSLIHQPILSFPVRIEKIGPIGLDDINSALQKSVPLSFVKQSSVVTFSSKQIKSFSQRFRVCHEQHSFFFCLFQPLCFRIERRMEVHCHQFQTDRITFVIGKKIGREHV